MAATSQALASSLPSTAAQDLLAPGRRAAILGAFALVSMLAFEAMAVAAAMPAVTAALQGLAQYTLAFGGTLAAAVLGMVWAGRQCDRHGPARSTQQGLLAFAAGLLLAGAAPSMAWLIAGRLLQGLGSGQLGVALYAGAARLVPEPLHPRLFAGFAAAWVLPGLLGPALAGGIVAQFGWRWVFLGVALLLPPVAALLLPALRRLPPQPLSGAQGAPVTWAALAALGALLLHLAGGPELALPKRIGAGLLGLGLALWAARRLLPPGSLRGAPGLPAVVALRGLLAAGFFSAEVFIPLYLHQAQGWSLSRAGLALSAAALAWSGGSALQARLRPAQRCLALRAGFALQAAGVAALALPLLGAPAGWMLPAWGLAGLGTGLAFPLLSVQTLALSAPGTQGRNAAALQLADALATSAAMALAGACFNWHPSYGAVLGLALLWTLLGLGLSGRAFAGAVSKLQRQPA